MIASTEDDRPVSSAVVTAANAGKTTDTTKAVVDVGSTVTGYDFEKSVAAFVTQSQRTGK
jgi:hypothetical protein